jgi:hypothetical protein
LSPSGDFFEDGSSRGGPDERFGFDVVFLQIGFDCGLEFSNATENAAAMASLVIKPKKRSTFESASADVVFDFDGPCASGCNGTATGVLMLTSAYKYGANITSAYFVSFSCKRATRAST